MVARTDNVAAYVDLLGVRSLLKRRPKLARPDGWDRNEPRGMCNAFHNILDAYAFNSLDSHFDRFFSWSDCCFIDFGSLTDPLNPEVQTGALYRAVLDSACLMHSFIANLIPVRIGIGLGSFETIVARQQFVDQPRRLIVSSRFHGTAVMNAWAAEQCTPRGLRVFLHPEFDKSQLQDIPGVVPFSSETVPSTNSPRCAVSTMDAGYEINYVHPELRKPHDVTKQPVDSKALIESVGFMLESVPKEHHEHYTNTLHLLRNWSAR